MKDSAKKYGSDSGLTPEENKRYDELRHKTHDVGFLYMTDDSVYEIIRTAASYRSKFYSRIKLHMKDGYDRNAGKSHYTIDKLKQTTMALQSGKIKSGIDVTEAKNRINIYEKFVKLLKRAVLDFDNKNSSFEKFEKDIRTAADFSSKNGIYGHDSSSVVKKAGYGWSKQPTGGVEIDINNFSEGLIEIREQMDNIVKDCQELSKRIQYNYNGRSTVSDIDKAVDERRKNGRKEFSAERKRSKELWNKRLAEGKVTKDEYDRHMELADDLEFGDTPAATLAKAYSDLAGDLRIVTNFCRRVVEQITVTEESCASYVKMVQLYKKNGSGYTRKGIKKMPHKVQRTSKQTTYQVNKDNDLSNKRSLGDDFVL